VTRGVRRLTPRLGGILITARSTPLFFLLLLATAAAAAVLAVEAAKPQAAHAEAFQRLVGGTGFGPALDLDGCAFGFDPRLDGSCGADHGPVPGGTCFCPRHACSVFAYPPPGVGHAAVP
jgi:hypothetical protein